MINGVNGLGGCVLRRGSVFLLDCLKSKLAWFKSGDLKRGLVIFLPQVACLVEGFWLIISALPFRRRAMKKQKAFHFRRSWVKRETFTPLLKKRTLFFATRKVGEKEKRRDKHHYIFLSEGSMFPPQAVELAGKRGFFQKLFLLDSIKVRFIVPPSGIKEGSVRAVSSYEFVALSP